MFAETISIFDSNKAFSVDFMWKMSLFEVWLEQLLENFIVKEILHKILNQFLSLRKLTTVRVKQAYFFKEGLSKQFIFNCCGAYFLNKGKNFDDFWVSLLFEQPLREHQNKPDVLSIIELNFLYFCLRTVCELKVGVDMLQGLKIKLIKVNIKQTCYEVLAAASLYHYLSIIIHVLVPPIPVITYGVNIPRMNNNLPFLENLHQLQLSILLIS